MEPSGTGDLPILWQSDGRQYNPDFVAVETGGVHWLIEAKMEKELSSEDVKGKAEAAKRWANHVSGDSTPGPSGGTSSSGSRISQRPAGPGRR